MKTLKNNKLLAWMLALITAVCAFLGVMLTTPLNTALADDTAQQITNETFPDTSTWEEKDWLPEGNDYIPPEDPSFVKEHFSGKMLRLYINEGGAIDVEIVVTEDNLNSECFLSKTGDDFVFGVYETGTVAYKKYNDYIDFIFYAKDNVSVADYSINGNAIPKIGDYIKLLEPAAETPDETPSETPDVEDEGKWSDKTADWLNENLGLTLTGSVVSVVVVVLVVYFLFFRKRR